MALKPTSRRPVGQQTATPPRLGGARSAGSLPGAATKPAPPKPPTLAEQKAEFTAEGAPPPGKRS